MRIGKYYITWRTGNDIHVLQLYKGGPLYSIMRIYYSDDAGMNLSYIPFAIPKKYKSERPL